MAKSIGVAGLFWSIAQCDGDGASKPSTYNICVYTHIIDICRNIRWVEERMSVYRTLKQTLWGKRERQRVLKTKTEIWCSQEEEKEREAGEAREGFMVLYTFFGLGDFSRTFTWVSRKKES